MEQKEHNRNLKSYILFKIFSIESLFVIDENCYWLCSIAIVAATPFSGQSDSLPLHNWGGRQMEVGRKPLSENSKIFPQSIWEPQRKKLV